MKRQDFTGRIQGHWVVIGMEREDPLNPNCDFWTVRCTRCGNEKSLMTSEILKHRNPLCACRRHNYAKAQKLETGESKTRLYKIWVGMLSRCEDPDSLGAKYYYNKGIRVCDEWRENFHGFKRWSIENGYTDVLTIDRIDNDLGYSPDNCRWVTKDVQYNNKKRIQIEMDGSLVNLVDICKEKNLSCTTVYQRFRKYSAKSEQINIEELFAPAKKRTRRDRNKGSWAEPKTTEARIIARIVDMMSKDDRLKALAMMRVMFADYFENGSDDDAT